MDFHIRSSEGGLLLQSKLHYKNGETTGVKHTESPQVHRLSSNTAIVLNLHDYQMGKESHSMTAPPHTLPPIKMYFHLKHVLSEILINLSRVQDQKLHMK